MYNFKQGQVWDCYCFARNMRGNHNPNMIMERSEWEIFRDDFRGKLGEVALRNYITALIPHAVINSPIDFEVTPRGQWDRVDMVVNDKFVSVKSIKGNARFLLIETYRYDENGNCAYLNDDGTEVRTDLYALVRVAIEPEINADDMDYRSINDFWASQGGRKVQYEILGGISHQEFWRIKHYAPAGMKCDLNNLTRICQGLEPEKGNEGGKLTETLQQNNYVIDSRNELTRLENIL